MHQYNPSIFREYDIRGTFEQNLTETDAYYIGKAYAATLKKGIVAIGFDGRISSPALSEALIKGITDSGLDVINIGLVPTPALYFAVFHLNLDGGIMVTGSHNPPDQNGFKLMIGKESLHGRAIKQLSEVTEFLSGKGKVEKTDIRADYIKRVTQGLAKSSLRIGYDPANGAAGEIIDELAPKLSSNHFCINTKIDGTFPSHHADPTVEKNLEQLKSLVLENNLDVGFAFDGDGDRVGIVDNKGRPIWGDQILAILAEDVLEQRPGANVVVDVKTSKAVIDRIKKLGGKPIIWKCGHSLIKAMMKELDAPLAGEMSAHIFFADNYYGYDDGIYAAIRFLEVMKKTGKTSAELLDALPKMHSSPEHKIVVEDLRKFMLVEELKNMIAPPPAFAADVPKISGKAIVVDGIRMEHAYGWWLVRASNTGPNIIARYEADSESNFKKVEAELQGYLSKLGLAL